MGTKYLGEEFDTHGGGMDLVFPHHECEIAQSTAALGKETVHYWMHNNMITINGQKMGKSLGNAVSLEEFFNGQNAIQKPLLQFFQQPQIFFMKRGRIFEQCALLAEKFLRREQFIAQRMFQKLQFLRQQGRFGWGGGDGIERRDRRRRRRRLGKRDHSLM